jgi:hypothetical protein
MLGIDRSLIRGVALVWGTALFVAGACSSGGVTSGAGGSTGSAGTSGAAGTTGNGGTTGAAGTTGNGGTTGAAGTSGSAGTSGGAGTGAGAGSTGTSPAGSAGVTGSGGAGTSGSAGTSGGAGTTGGAGTAGGAGGNGAAGRGGSIGGGGSGAGGDAGHGGSGGAGAGGGGAGAGGGSAGAGGGGSGGTAGGSGALRITRGEVFPVSQLAMLGLRIVVDSHDTAVVLGPSANADTDPGPALTWYPLSGAPRKLVFANATTPWAIALDGADAIWLVGQLWRPVSFGGPTLQAIDSGYYLVKLAADGTHILSKAIARAHDTWIYGLATDAQGNVYVAGTLQMFATQPLTSSSFVSKFSPTGELLRDQVFAGTDSQNSAQGVAVAPTGEVVVVGEFAGSVTIGTTQLTSLAPTLNGYVAVLDGTTLAPQRAMRFGAASFDLANSVQVTSAGAVRVSGLLSGATSIGGMTVQAHENGSPFVAELSLTGVASWVRVVSGRGIVFGADTNTAGRTFAAGRIDGATHDAFLAAVGPDPTLTVPLRADTGEMGNGALAAAADRHGGVWVGGEFSGTVDFGSGPLRAPNASQPANFLVHLEP